MRRLKICDPNSTSGIGPIAFFSLCLFFACGQRLERVVQVLNDGQEIRTFSINSAGQIQGIFVREVNGIKVEQAEYINDTLHGMRELYDDDGRLEVRESYVHGVFDGPYRTYHKNGNIKLDGAYENNMMQKVWQTYDSLGNLIEKVEMHDNMENGPFTEYYPNGVLKTEGIYKDGANEHDTLKMYNEAGKLNRIMFCVEGFCNTIWQSSDVE